MKRFTSREKMHLSSYEIDDAVLTATQGESVYI